MCGVACGLSCTMRSIAISLSMFSVSASALRRPSLISFTAPASPVRLCEARNTTANEPWPG